MKRLDPDLPFYYYTSANSRFYEGELLPDFSLPPAKPKKSKRLPQRELLGASHRVTMAVRGAPTIRATFHNVPVDLPPPPSSANQPSFEHSYAANT